VHGITEHERCEQCTNDLLLQRGVWMKMLASGTQDEDVEDADEGADVREL